MRALCLHLCEIYKRNELATDFWSVIFLQLFPECVCVCARMWEKERARRAASPERLHLNVEFALIRNTWKGASAVPFALKCATIWATQQFVCFVPLATDPWAVQRAGNGSACAFDYLRSCHRKCAFTQKIFDLKGRLHAARRQDRPKQALWTFCAAAPSVPSSRWGDHIWYCSHLWALSESYK